MRGLDRHELACFGVDPAAGVRMHLGPAVPRRLHHRVGYFLQPGLVGAASIVVMERGIGDQHEGPLVPLAWVEWRRLELKLSHLRAQLDGLRLGLLPQSAAAKGIGPERLELALRSDLLLEGSPFIPEIRVKGCPREASRDFFAQRSGDLEQQVTHVLRVEHRLHDRLHQSANPRAGLMVSPGFERRVNREDEIGSRGRLVREAGEAHDERHSRQRGGEARGRWQREQRVHIVQDQQLDPVPVHGVDEVEHVPIGARLAHARIGTEHDGRADIAGDVVQKIHRHLHGRGIGIARRRAPTDREAGPRSSHRIAKQHGELFDFLGGDRGAARHGLR